MALAMQGTDQFVPYRESRVPRRYVNDEDRLVFLGISVWAMAMAAFMLADETGARRVWAYPIWGVMLGLGGLLTAWFLVRQMASFRVRGLAAAMMVVGCAGRGAGMLLAVVNGTSASLWSGLLGMGAWTMLGFLLYLTWRSRVPHGSTDARRAG
jgi:hypothetical protein